MVGPPPQSWEIHPFAAASSLVAPGVWRLRLPMPWPEITHANAFAIDAGDGGIALVDCGLHGHDSQCEALAHALASAGHRVEDVRLLVITHAHVDHVGLAAWVAEHSGCPIYCHPRNEHLLDAVSDPDAIRAARERRAVREGVPAALLPDYASVAEENEGALTPIECDVELVDGVRVPSALGDWVAVETPGHCPSHVCLFQPERRLLLAGDLLSRGFVAVFDYGYSADPVDEYLGSLDRVAELGAIALALPGHGRAFGDVPAVLATYRDGIAGEIEQVRAAVAALGLEADSAGPRSEPVGAYAITEHVIPAAAARSERVWRMGDVAAYLRHLRLRGIVERREAADGRFDYRCA